METGVVSTSGGNRTETNKLEVDAREIKREGGVGEERGYRGGRTAKKTAVPFERQG